MSSGGVATVISRRAALQRTAAAGVGTLAAPTVLTSTAFADSGTVKCRHAYTTASVLTGSVVRSGFLGLGSNANFALAVSPPGPATCPCGGSPTVTYSFRVSATAGSTATAPVTPAWGASNTFSASLNVGYISFLDLDFSYTIQVGVQVRCAGRGPVFAYTCRFQTAAGSGASSYTLTPTALSATTVPPNLPPCT